ncbi:MAG: hypothetical protein PHN63_07250, partial [Candidatus Omnitrophica bacterium]|nr:hypothetical protein [Candidatus Omnitrophota bacterium]
PKFRKVLDGRFEVDEKNNLSYRIKSPLSEDENIPHSISLAGDWSLTKEHELKLTLDKESRETFGDQITLSGQILDAGRDSLIFSVATRSAEGAESTHILNLRGWWRADGSNRLSFYLRKENGRYDILTFNGAWEINKDHCVVYTYKKAALIRKKSESHSLIFKGYWDIRDSVRISYLLDGDTQSAFDFKASAGILAGSYVKYEIGIGARKRTRPVKRAVTLSGQWKLKKDAGLVFECEYENGKVRGMVFGADAELTDKDTVLFRLRDSVDNKDLGMVLELSRKVLDGDGEAFFRALASKRELALYAGAAWRW